MVNSKISSGYLITRKAFFKWASLALLVPLYKIWQTTVNTKQATDVETIELTIDANISDGVHFFEKLIFLKNGNEFRLFSSKCSHLGCRINRVENGELVCPCHGSRYNLEGKSLKGPATNSLAEVQFEMERNPDKVTFRFKN